MIGNYLLQQYYRERAHYVPSQSTCPAKFSYGFQMKTAILPCSAESGFRSTCVWLGPYNDPSNTNAIFVYHLSLVRRYMELKYIHMKENCSDKAYTAAFVDPTSIRQDELTKQPQIQADFSTCQLPYATNALAIRNRVLITVNGTLIILYQTFFLPSGWFFRYNLFFLVDSRRKLYFLLMGTLKGIEITTSIYIGTPIVMRSKNSR